MAEYKCISDFTRPCSSRISHDTLLEFFHKCFMHDFVVWVGVYEDIDEWYIFPDTRDDDPILIWNQWETRSWIRTRDSGKEFSRSIGILVDDLWTRVEYFLCNRLEWIHLFTFFWFWCVYLYTWWGENPFYFFSSTDERFWIDEVQDSIRIRTKVQQREKAYEYASSDREIGDKETSCATKRSENRSMFDVFLIWEQWIGMHVWRICMNISFMVAYSQEKNKIFSLTNHPYWSNPNNCLKSCAYGAVMIIFSLVIGCIKLSE